jgi:hypothetical protein
LTNLLSKIILLTAFVASTGMLKAQDDEIELNQEQWEAVRDFYAVEAIKLLARMDTLQLSIDSLKQVKDMTDVYDCENELYAIVGATKQEVSDFRKKFEETEKKINNKFGTPKDIKEMYFDEISVSKIRCLPEFSDRFASMKNKFAGELYPKNEIPAGTYLVVKGDCLWKISENKYNSRYMWPAIWDANRISIINPEDFEETYYKKIHNPNLIYPGQVLKIPSLSEEDKKQAEEKSKYYRKKRKLKNN